MDFVPDHELVGVGVRVRYVCGGMQSKLGSSALVAAAACGLILGACKGKEPGPSSGEVQASAPASAGSGSHKGDKACCKGLNDCKGKGGCAVAGKHDCAGKNDCKGQGGCNMRC
jgi:hypothetical protein